MAGPGRYVRDATEGIISAEDLPEAKIIERSCSHRRRPCACCGPVVIEIGLRIERFMIWAIFSRAGHTTFSSPIRCIIAPSAGSTSGLLINKLRGLWENGQANRGFG